VVKAYCYNSMHPVLKTVCTQASRNSVVHKSRSLTMASLVLVDQASQAVMSSGILGMTATWLRHSSFCLEKVWIGINLWALENKYLESQCGLQQHANICTCMLEMVDCRIKLMPILLEKLVGFFQKRDCKWCTAWPLC